MPRWFERLRTAKTPNVQASQADHAGHAIAVFFKLLERFVARVV